MNSKHPVILLVDDDEDDRELLSEAIKAIDTSCTIMTTKNGSEAMELLFSLDKQNGLPALIILDINMPGIDGKNTLARIRQIKSLAAIPVVVFSTGSSQIDRNFFGSYGVEMISKPYSYKEFVSKATELLSFANTEFF